MIAERFPRTGLIPSETCSACLICPFDRSNRNESDRFASDRIGSDRIGFRSHALCPFEPRRNATRRSVGRAEPR
jgi:hypothetical protein